MFLVEERITINMKNKMSVVSVDIGCLNDSEYNPRKLTKKQFQDIKNSLTKYGFVENIVVNENKDRKNIIIGGHQRVRVAKAMGMKNIPVHYVDIGDIKQEKELNIRLNKNSGEWDWDLLANIFDETDLMDWGFDDDDLQFKELDTVEGLTDEDDVPEAPEDPITKQGDLWLLGEHRVLCGDATKKEDVERLMDGQKADMVFTDPPYGYKYLSNRCSQSKHKEILNDDKILDFLPACKKFMLENSTIYVCGSFQTISKWIEYVSKHFFYKNLIVWKKNNWSMGDLKGSFAGQHELIIFANQGKVEILGKRDTDVWEFNKETPKLHPTQKPIELIEFAMSKFKGGIILDLFGGSGSTLIACEKTNRNCYMMELDPHYCDVIVKRWEDYTGKEATLYGNS
jgi:DNA modification methylase|tara:strand:+ start:6392 stop:7585 length:1194 start_codon:yes stop_codon:yes gene_type:complete